MKAAEHGDVFAQFALAERYNEGKGVERNVREALKWYLKAAGHGHVEAQWIVACIFDGNSAEVEPDSKEAYKWYTKAACQGHAKAQEVLSRDKWKKMGYKIHLHEGNPVIESTPLNEQPEEKPFTPERLAKLTSSAEEGDVDSQYDLGIRYYNGEGVQKDHVKALSWFLMAAEQDDAQAQFNLGIMYGRGEGTKKDVKVSMQWLQKAASQNHAEALQILSGRQGKNA
jgi:hypothetical protein